MKKIASLCDAYNLPIAPHNPNGPISTIASTHVMSAAPNYFRQDFMFTDVPGRDSMPDRPLLFVMGTSNCTISRASVLIWLR